MVVVRLYSRWNTDVRFRFIHAYRDKRYEGGYVEQMKLVSLSKREREVLRLLAAGRPATQIAKTLGIRISTVRVYVRTMRRKLDASNIPHAIAQAFYKGVLDHGVLPGVPEIPLNSSAAMNKKQCDRSITT